MFNLNLSRPVKTIALAQVAVLICGLIALNVELHRAGYPRGPYMAGSNFAIYQWSNLTLFLRRFGLVLLVVPWGWTAVAQASTRRFRFTPSLDTWLIFGSIIPVVMIVTFVFVMLLPYTETPQISLPDE
jgi:uncharacterized membrane protein YidH (DUF202 family)